MKLIEPQVEQLASYNPYRLIELIGRTCYKSESAITDTSCNNFVQRLIDHEHFAMLEHARFTFQVNGELIDYEALINIPSINYKCSLTSPDTCYINVSMSHLYNPKWDKYPLLSKLLQKFRDIVEYTYEFKHFDLNYILPDNIRLVAYIDNEMFKYYTVKFVCDRGISHELVRHRCAVAQESTRYCGYQKEKFGQQITYVLPQEYKEWIPGKQKSFKEYLKQCESEYLYQTTKGKLTPQIARGFLPHFLKTEVILTMNSEQWDHFFNLRYFGKTGSPHPDMKHIAQMAYNLLHK